MPWAPRHAEPHTNQGIRTLNGRIARASSDAYLSLVGDQIAQSRCANPGSSFAKTWVHNGFLTVNGEKMSKSLGNFITVRDLLDKGVRGEVIRLALLMTKYNEPLDWNEKLLHDAKTTLDKWYRQIPHPNPLPHAGEGSERKALVGEGTFLEALCDDLNFPRAFSLMHGAKPGELLAMGQLLGFFGQSAEQWFKGDGDEDIQSLIDARTAAKKAKDWEKADKIRERLAEAGIILEDRPDGTTDWRRE